MSLLADPALARVSRGALAARALSRDVLPHLRDEDLVHLLLLPSGRLVDLVLDEHQRRVRARALAARTSP